MALLSCIERLPRQTAIGSVIWLHGLGADGNDFAPIAQELQLPLRFVFPHAPMQAVTLNQGYVMRAWFDIYSLNFDKESIDFDDIAHSMIQIEALIEKEKQSGIPANKIVLAGFSQGAIVALMTALRHPERLAGVLALSGCLPSIAEWLPDRVNDIPIFMAHGTEDPIVPYDLDLVTYEVLKKNGYSVKWHSYRIGHSVCDEEVMDIRRWFESIFNLGG